jgi:hypothetical protein
MKIIAVAITFVGMTLASAFYTAPACAQATRTWISGVGDDANPCSRTAPCKTWAGAISKTAAGGEIDALDPGGFGAVTINKSITLDGGGGQVASVLVSGTLGIAIAAAANDVVTIRNVRFQGLLGNGSNPSGAGTNAIQINSAGSVLIENCVIENFAQNGINDTRTSGGTQLTVKNTILSNNAQVGIRSAATATNFGTLENVQVTGGGFGIAAAANNYLVFRNSTASVNSGGGIAANPGSIIFVDNSLINSNGTGVLAQGTVLLTNSDIIFNTTAISGATTSYGNNRIYGNASLGTTPSVASQN